MKLDSLRVEELTSDKKKMHVHSMKEALEALGEADFEDDILHDARIVCMIRYEAYLAARKEWMAITYHEGMSEQELKVLDEVEKFYNLEKSTFQHDLAHYRNVLQALNEVNKLKEQGLYTDIFEVQNK